MLESKLEIKKIEENFKKSRLFERKKNLTPFISQELLKKRNRIWEIKRKKKVENLA